MAEGVRSGGLVVELLYDNEVMSGFEKVYYNQAPCEDFVCLYITTGLLTPTISRQRDSVIWYRGFLCVNSCGSTSRLKVEKDKHHVS